VRGQRPDARGAALRIEAHDQHRQLLDLVALDHADLVVPVVLGEAVLAAQIDAAGLARTERGAHVFHAHLLQRALVDDVGQQAALIVALFARADRLLHRGAQALALLHGFGGAQARAARGEPEREPCGDRGDDVRGPHHDTSDFS
jgi:hypothetical protein